MGSIITAKDKWQGFLKVDDDRNAFIKGLLDELEDLYQKARLLEEEKDCEKESKAHFHQMYKNVENQLRLQRLRMDSNAFIPVLIDGDCMNFLNSFVQKKETGGREAAQELRNCTVDYLEKEFEYHDQGYKIIIVVCCNLKGLSKTSSDNGVGEKPEDFQLFVRGFNMGDPMCYFVDAGSGKECTDHKLRDLFSFYIGQVHCKHIIFGGSTDNGYARMLQPLMGNERERERITLLEGPPWASELASLVPKFNTSRFPTVFRDTKFPARRVSFSTTPPASVSPKQSWASAVQSRPQELEGQPARQPTPPARAASNTKVHRNSSGQRVDNPIRYSATLVNAIKPKKLCNTFYLTGYCPFNDCCHSHGEKLSEQGMDALRVIARMKPCLKGLKCDDEHCFYGHRCPRGIECEINACRFSYEMHRVDQVIADE